MPHVTSVERIGVRKGIQRGIGQGLEQERLLLLRVARKRFAADVAEQSAPMLKRVASPRILEDLADALLDAADAEA
jgi:hypothetical protein